MVVFSNYSVYSLFHSIDAGQSWNKVAGNLEQNPSGSGNGPSCRDAEIILLGNDTLYLVGTTVGLFGTSHLDGENTVWEQIAHSTLGSTIVEYITYRESDGLLVVGTFGNGVYQTHLTSIGDVLDVNNITKNNFEISLLPNPVTNMLSIDLMMDHSSSAKVVIYDELVRKAGIYNQFLSVGENTITLNIQDYKSGTYFVSILINNHKFVKQIIKK